jgi:hypothetical protein
VLTVDHRFALRSPALPSAPDKKSFSSINSPILACARRCALHLAVKDDGSLVEKLIAPLRGSP